MAHSVLLVAVSVLSVSSLALAGWLYYAQARCKEHRAQLDDANCQVESYKDEISSLKTEIALAQGTQKNLEQQLKQFNETQQKMKDAFNSSASDALERSSKQFLELAKKSFEGEQKDAKAQLEQRKQAVEALVRPIGEALTKYNSSLTEIEKARQASYGSLNKQLELMLADQQRLQQATGDLAQALRRPEVRGQWGEMTLHRLVELAGMSAHCDFDEQRSIEGHADNKQRPDMIVNLPNSRTIIIDAKTPLDAFLNAAQCGDDEQRNQYLNQHIKQIQTQVNNLSSKKYNHQFDRCPDFVVLFIPGESFLYPAIQREPKLVETAMSKGVVIATPTTLISLLKVIALGWQEQQVSENAQKIKELGCQLHERLCVVVDHIQKLGQSLGSAVSSYNHFVGSVENRLMPAGRKFEELGAKSAKALPGEVKIIETVPRDLRTLV